MNLVNPISRAAKCIEMCSQITGTAYPEFGIKYSCKLVLSCRLAMPCTDGFQIGWPDKCTNLQMHCTLDKDV